MIDDAIYSIDIRMFLLIFKGIVQWYCFVMKL